MLPIDQVKLVVVSAAQATNILLNILGGGSIFGALGLLSTLAALKDLNKQKFLDQIKDVDPTERAELLALFKTALVLDNKILEKKFEEGADCLNEAVMIGLDAYDLILESETLIAKIKTIVDA